jgi:flagellar biosynthetic protein FliO
MNFLKPQSSRRPGKPAAIQLGGCLGGTSALVVRTSCATICLSALGGYCDTTNVLSAPFSSASLPDAGPSLLRVLGALALVLGIFLGGAWLVRNGRLSAFTRGRSSRLNVLETRSLGARQVLYVVGYGQERFLIGSTPAGINLLSHLAPPADGESDAPAPPANLGFPQALAQVLKRQSAARKTEGPT